MLRSVTIPGYSRNHDYPKKIMTYLLTLNYWRHNDMPIWKMMEHNICILNEELGELYYSILSRCVLGDNIKCNFDHMNKIYKLLPIYRDIREEMFVDNNNKDSITWHHQIPVDAPDVTATAFFFNRLIRYIVEGKHRSYDVEKEYKSQIDCTMKATKSYIPLVYNTMIIDEMNPLITTIKTNITTNFLKDHVEDWPFIPDGEVEALSDHAEEEEKANRPSIHNMDGIDSKHSDDVETKWGAPWEQCIPNHFAVQESKFDEGKSKGISVYKILSITNDCLDEHGKVLRTFSGREYTCTLLNTNGLCVTKGKWHFHAKNSQSGVHDIFHYDVISYFEKLHNNMLPPSVIKDIDLIEQQKVIFDTYNPSQTE